MNEDVCVIALKREGEHWIIFYRESSRAGALQQLGRWASDPDMRLTWIDAAMMAKKIRSACSLGDDSK